MRRVLMLTLAAAALFGCRRPATVVPMSPPGPPGPPRPPQLPGVPNPPSPKWSQAFDLACAGSITPPVVAPDGSRVAFCARLFESERGSFEEILPSGVAAVRPDKRVLFNDYSGNWKVGGPGVAKHASIDGNRSDRLAISPSGKRFVTFEGDSLVVRGIEPLKELARIQIGDVSPKPFVGFLADERAIAIVPGDCTTERGKNKDGSRWQLTKCASKSWMVVEGDQLVKLRDAGDVSNIAFAAGGSRALIERDTGERAVVALPGGEEIAKLPERAGDDHESYWREPMAIDQEGKRVAYIDGGVVIASVDGSGATELARMEGAEPSSLVFAPDGKTLYLANNSRMVALREGEPERLLPVASYSATPPPGFAPFRARCPAEGEPDDFGEDDLCRARQRAFGRSGTLVDDGREISLPEGHLKAFIDREHFIEVYVTAVDAAEFGDKDDAAWAEHVVSSSVWFGGQTDADSLKTIKMRGPRSFDYAEFWRDGCDPKDIYVSVIERGGLLYKVRIEVPPEHPQKKLAPLFKAFVDEPFGSTDAAAHAFVKPPPGPDGPC